MVLQRASRGILGIVMAFPCLGQSSQSDSQILQQIPVEIKAIHEEMRVTETTQVLLTELEVQQGVVNRDMRRVDEARSQLEETQAAQRHNAGELARAEDEFNQTTDAALEKEISEAIKSIKNTVAAQNAQEQERVCKRAARAGGTEKCTTDIGQN